MHSDGVIDALPLDAIGHIPWWPPEHREVRLHRTLVHTIAEAHRHAGQADIVRELIDGSAGLLNGNEAMPAGDRTWWENYYGRLEDAARKASGT